MAKWPIGLATLGASLLLLMAAPSSPAQAIGLHIRLGGGPIGVVRSIASMAVGGLRGRRGARVRMARAEATSSSPLANLTRGPDWVTRPVARVQVAAMAALAGWHGPHGTKGWWQHGDGGYGWVGPLFWPFAYYDIYDYTLWGDGMGFWGYGYRDIYAAIFTPYDDDEIARYVSPPHGRKFRRFPTLARICGAGISELSGLPVEQIKQAVQLSSEEQRAALDDLAKASVEAAETIRSACPTGVALTPSDRLAAMQKRLEAMKSAIAAIQPPFENFYELLDDGQKGRLAAFAGQRSPFAPKVPTEQSCTPPEALPWPTSEIEAKLHLNEWQRDELDVVRRMIGFAIDTLNLNCQPDETLTPPARLATADARLDVMLNAIKLVRPALDDFFATLNDGQKAQFEAIGQRRTS